MGELLTKMALLDASNASECLALLEEMIGERFTGPLSVSLPPEQVAEYQDVKFYGLEEEWQLRLKQGTGARMSALQRSNSATEVEAELKQKSADYVLKSKGLSELTLNELFELDGRYGSSRSLAGAYAEVVLKIAGAEREDLGPLLELRRDLINLKAFQSMSDSQSAMFAQMLASDDEGVSDVANVSERYVELLERLQKDVATCLVSFAEDKNLMQIQIKLAQESEDLARVEKIPEPSGSHKSYIAMATALDTVIVLRAKDPSLREEGEISAAELAWQNIPTLFPALVDAGKPRMELLNRWWHGQGRQAKKLLSFLTFGLLPKLAGASPIEKAEQATKLADDAKGDYQAVPTIEEPQQAQPLSPPIHMQQQQEDSESETVSVAGESENITQPPLAAGVDEQERVHEQTQRLDEETESTISQAEVKVQEDEVAFREKIAGQVDKDTQNNKTVEKADNQVLETEDEQDDLAAAERALAQFNAGRMRSKSMPHSVAVPEVKEQAGGKVTESPAAKEVTSPVDTNKTPEQLVSEGTKHVMQKLYHEDAKEATEKLKDDSHDQVSRIITEDPVTRPRSQSESEIIQQPDRPSGNLRDAPETIVNLKVDPDAGKGLGFAEQKDTSSGALSEADLDAATPPQHGQNTTAGVDGNGEEENKGEESVNARPRSQSAP